MFYDFCGCNDTVVLCYVFPYKLVILDPEHLWKQEEKEMSWI